MGYLDNTSITVDAILTKKGRELLASSRNAFEITKFALGDDEVDYTLYNPSHTLGSSYYGEMIENMPVLEAITDENYALKYKLVTFPRNTISVPLMTVNPTTISLPQSSRIPLANPGQGTTGGPNQTTITIGGQMNQQGSFTVTLLDGDLGIIFPDPNSTSRFIFESVFTLTPQLDQTTTIIVQSNKFGTRIDIPVTVTVR